MLYETILNYPHNVTVIGRSLHKTDEIFTTNAFQIWLERTHRVDSQKALAISMLCYSKNKWLEKADFYHITMSYEHCRDKMELFTGKTIEVLTELI